MASHFFFDQTDLSKDIAENITKEALQTCEDGELYLEYKESEAVALDDSKIKSSSYDVTQGFGLRGVSGEQTTYSHANEISEAALKRASQVVQETKKGGTFAAPPAKTNQKLYTDENPLDKVPFKAKVDLLGAIDMYLRKKDPRIKQVSANLRGSWQVVQILRPDGYSASDYRPFTVLNIIVAIEENGRMEMGRSVIGIKGFYDDIIKEATWKHHADEAHRKASTNLKAVPAPAGEMPVVLGPGIPGVLLHEAVGHGLEGDFNRKGSSTFSKSMGQRIAAPGVTVIDGGNITNMDHAHGNLTIDDEGTPTSQTVLIEDGIMTGHMNDRLNARLMGEKATGNGRRQSFAHTPMPRMTNTFMLAGNHTQEEMIQSVDKGIIALDFGGGQVDITSGKFVFSTSEAYLIEKGKITTPIKGATLVGSGAEVMQKITMIGDDLVLDQGVGMCGKGGQSVVVGLGQPSLKISSLTVGGTG